MSLGNDFIYGARKHGGQHGDIFTSQPVVRYMLDLVEYTEESNLSQIRILEPSCGEGEFIEEIAHRLLLSGKKYEFDAEAVFQNNVYAYDIDAEKVEKCRERIKKLGFKDTERNICVADFLKVRLIETDIVIGNPPYIRYENIPEPMLKYCRESFETFHYRCDLYIPFFEKSLSALAPNGKHCFICSNRWLKNVYGKKMRQLVAQQYNLRFIINLEQADAFQEEVLAYPAVTLIEANKPESVFNYAECKNVQELSSLSFSQKLMPKDSDWTTAFNTVADNQSFLTIEQQGFKIGIGVATGADAIFISKELPEKVEQELILPGINARDLRGNQFQWQGEYLLNPYNPDGTLIDLEIYPRAKAYLQQHKERLSQRHIAKKSPLRWYKTIDRINPKLLSQPKILLPDMSGNTFVFVDDGEFYPLHNIYYITGCSSIQLRVLAAFLMSDFVRNQLSSVTNTMNGGFSRWQSQHLRKLRIPPISSIPANEVQLLLDYYEKRDITSLNSKIQNIVRLFPRCLDSLRGLAVVGERDSA